MHFEVLTLCEAFCYLPCGGSCILPVILWWGYVTLHEFWFLSPEAKTDIPMKFQAICLMLVIHVESYSQVYSAVKTVVSSSTGPDWYTSWLPEVDLGRVLLAVGVAYWRIYQVLDNGQPQKITDDPPVKDAVEIWLAAFWLGCLFCLVKSDVEPGKLHIYLLI